MQRQRQQQQQQQQGNSQLPATSLFPPISTPFGCGLGMAHQLVTIDNIPRVSRCHGNMGGSRHPPCFWSVASTATTNVWPVLTPQVTPASADALRAAPWYGSSDPLSQSLHESNSLGHMSAVICINKLLGWHQ